MSYPLSKSRAEENLKAYLAAIADPFGSHVAIHVPDSFSGNTVPLILTATSSFSKISSTFGGLKIVPEMDKFYHDLTPTSTPTALQFGERGGDNSILSNHPDLLSNMNLDQSLFRMRAICLAVQISYIGPADQMAGTIKYCLSPDPSDTGAPADSDGWSDLAASSGEVAVRREPFTLVSKLFATPEFSTLTTNAHSYLSLNSINIVVQNIDPDLFMVKTKYFIEGVCKLSGSLQSLARPSPSGAIVNHDGGNTAAFYTSIK
jgi:hypothetical protein